MTLKRILIALSAIIALSLIAPAALEAQNNTEPVRVIARLQADGRIEFGLRTADGDQHPTRRLFPRGDRATNWLRSTPITLSDGETQVRIIARRLANRRVEFGVRTENPRRDLLPRARFFSASITDTKLRVSSPVEVPLAATQQQAQPPAPESQQDDASDDLERIQGGPRDGLAVQGSIIGDPNAPVLIVEYGDPF